MICSTCGAPCSCSCDVALPVKRDRTSSCSSCGAAIVWVETSSGKSMPLDAKPERRWVRAGRTGESAHFAETYVSHFATCPNAAQHRRPR